MPTFTRTGDLGTTMINHSGQVYDVYNWTGAIQRVNKPTPNYPLQIKSPPAHVEAYGGRFIGLLDPTIHRAKGTGLYQDYNSAAVFVQGAEAHLHHWTFGLEPSAATGHVWDCMRINGDDAADSLVEYCIAYGCRDDFIESDSVAGGSLTVRNCLADGVFAGISCTGNQLNRTIYLDNVLIRCTNFFEDEGEGAQYRTFGPMFKPDASGAHGPLFVANNCVFAYETHDGAAMNLDGQFGEGRVREAFRRWTGTNNYMCVLAAGTLPGGFPALPQGMTLLTGTTARNTWNTRRAEMIALINGGVAPGASYKLNAITVNPTTGVVSTDTTRPFPAQLVTMRTLNSAGSDTETVTIGVT